MFKKLMLLSLNFFTLNGLAAEPAQTAQASKQEIIAKIVTETVNSATDCGGPWEKN